MSRSSKSMPAPARRRKPVMGMDAMARHADEAVAVLKAMGSQHRLMLLCQLLEGERSVNQLADALELAQSVVSQHLSLLRRDGLVLGRREGQSIYYDIRDERVRTLMATLFELFCVDD
ncbi:ArsR/SmtB family transcription factor [Dyella humicola]|uniref:ArsR/SmtB family transcription factor n=1 Tax=Dyella humicola TaxID=2992126 RepID=UPI002250A866|nr:metalloregulator ArsR/SmtB family transcription factor [Dyella humicola]